MKYIITEEQLKIVKEKIIKIPFEVFDNDWDALQTFLEGRGNPKYSITDDLDLRETSIKSLGNLTSVGGNLLLLRTKIKSLGNLTYVGGNLNLRKTPIESLGNLTSVGGDLNLFGTQIKSLGNLTSVGGNFYLSNTSMSKQYTETQIRNMVEISGNLYI